MNWRVARVVTEGLVGLVAAAGVYNWYTARHDLSNTYKIIDDGPVVTSYVVPGNHRIVITKTASGKTSSNTLYVQSDGTTVSVDPKRINLEIDITTGKSGIK